jgi:cadmium resistance protein CadD (predicted permease)
MFGLGSLCYGLSLARTKGLSLLLSIMLTISGIASFIVLGNSFWNNTTLENMIEKYSYSFTPLVRVVAGIWLWKNSTAFHQNRDSQLLSVA